MNVKVEVDRNIMSRTTDISITKEVNGKIMALKVENPEWIELDQMSGNYEPDHIISIKCKGLEIEDHRRKIVNSSNDPELIAHIMKTSDRAFDVMDKIMGTFK